MAKKLKNIYIALLFVAAASIAGHTSAVAKSELKTTDYSHIIAVVGGQRTTAHQMTKESILLALGQKNEDSVERLKIWSDEFDRTLKGLRDGDTELKLPATTNQNILEQLNKIDELWSLFKSALRQSIADGSVSRASVAIIADLNVPLIQAMDDLIKEYKVESASGHLVSMLEAAIDISGQQRMLSQKMTKEVLLIAYEHDVEKYKKRLNESIAKFETNLVSMIEGNFEIRLFPAPTPQIRSQLRRVQTVWDRFRPIVEGTSKSGKIAPNDIQQVVGFNANLLEEMDTVLDMYRKL
jgi:superfamily I DNA/RNA helicase